MGAQVTASIRAPWAFADSTSRSINWSQSATEKQDEKWQLPVSPITIR